VGEGFVPEAKLGKAWKYVKCKSGEGECEKLVLSLSQFCFFSFYIMYLLLRYKNSHAALAMA